jgi:hypothetical protein
VATRPRLARRRYHVDETRSRYDARLAGVGALSVAFPNVHTARDVTRLANELFALPGRIAAERKRSVVIALDEFQAIDAFNGGSVEHALRGAAQQQRQVGYVFAGSEPSLMEKMIGPRRPFYKAGPVMRLQKIPPDVFAAWIERRFQKSGVRPEAGIAPRSWSSRVIFPTTCSAWLTKPGTTCAPPEAGGRGLTTCMTR